MERDELLFQPGTRISVMDIAQAIIETNRISYMAGIDATLMDYENNIIYACSTNEKSKCNSVGQEIEILLQCPIGSKLKLRLGKIVKDGGFKVDTKDRNFMVNQKLKLVLHPQMGMMDLTEVVIDANRICKLLGVDVEIAGWNGTSIHVTEHNALQFDKENEGKLMKVWLDIGTQMFRIVSLDPKYQGKVWDGKEIKDIKEG